MKKFFSVFMIAVCCMALAMPAQAQLIKFGVKGGVNLSKLKFEGMKDNSTGFFSDYGGNNDSRYRTGSGRCVAVFSERR